MRITEVRLKEIIREEVTRRLFETILEDLVVEELKRVGITEADEDYEAYKKRATAMGRRNFLKGLGAATVLGSIGAYGKGGADQLDAEIHDRRVAADEQYEDFQKTPEYALEEIGNMLKRPSNFSWTWHTESGSMQSGATASAKGEVTQLANFPLLVDKKYGTIGVLSSEYGVVRKIYDDLKKQLDANSEEITPGIFKTHKTSGTAKEWKNYFIDELKLPGAPNLAAGGDDGAVEQALRVGLLGDVGVSKEYDGMLYLPYDKMPNDMMLPNAALSPSEYYMKVWNKFVPWP